MTSPVKTGEVFMMQQPTEVVEPAGFDWSMATVCAGVGFVAGYAMMKAFRSKRDDDFNRV